jgi:hypothetical protein
MLTCLVNKQEEEDTPPEKTKIDWAMSAIAHTSPANKVAAHWAWKMDDWRARKTGILDTGATSGVAPEEEEEALEETGMTSSKTFMFLDKQTRRATITMLLKHKLCPTAREMNIVPGLHSTLISVSKLADAGYTTIFEHDMATIYDATTTTIQANNQPILEAPRRASTRLWKLQQLDPLDQPEAPAINNPQPKETLYAIFDLSSAQQTLLWYHAEAGFSTKETFTDAVHAGNCTTWPRLTIQMINRHFPDSTETAKGHLKGQRQGIQSTKQKVLDKFVKLATTKLKQETDNSPPAPIAEHNNIFIKVKDLSETIHTNQTGGFSFTSQQGNRYIMTAIHLDANYIFCQGNEKPDSGRDDGCLPANCQQDESSQPWAQKTYPGQRGVKSF